jgi:predicted site-specific integrase-resolvase
MCEYRGMKLAEWACLNGANPQPAYRWFRHGTMPVLARRLLGRRVMVADPGETGDDLVRDMIDVLASFWAQLYGRGVRNRVLRALAAAKQTPEAARVGGEDD